MKWQPIETAPKDGTKILGSSKYGGAWEKYGRYCAVIMWGKQQPDSECFYWIDAEHDFCESPSSYMGMTHWMPLPEPPKSD